ncbi:phosphoribosylformylglycinamidine synthase subunit PurQ [Rhodocytophaga aerolata]|uniref:Phosphoribosylformylglycinamidine synthase subunit PurQ n=1 Tax=Rhodocytophaga aerolata TaxID=455078 RepID=A0ABT8R0C3_9BACT|nr:phosphoribosylformylglycinamidine synthase subunit PurQ [Rhodocytophaga aerolata]MDO1444773.1 phosphoribosylformylglycinamidine synthase subunit PurQ [Rhodocytophaga aerolata]
MKFGVVVFPGSNCDEDIIYTLQHTLGQEVVKLWHKDTDLQGAECIVLPGGFSYGDYLRSGAIARFSPIMEKVVAHANQGGYVIGICNGFQILTEAGLLPGALLRNNGQKFICRNVYLKPQSTSTLLTKGLDPDKTYKIPIAHAEGRYYADQETVKELHANDQILFKYSSETGIIDEASNPNGSLENIAGISNARKNVFGMMPHPERAAEEALGNTDGRTILEGLVAQITA